jgi:hypothetical protein
MTPLESAAIDALLRKESVEGEQQRDPEYHVGITAALYLVKLTAQQVLTSRRMPLGSSRGLDASRPSTAGMLAKVIGTAFRCRASRSRADASVCAFR